MADTEPSMKQKAEDALKQYLSRQLQLPPGQPWRNLSDIQFPAESPGIDPLIRLFCKWNAIDLQYIYFGYYRLRYEAQDPKKGPTAASTAIKRGHKVMRFRPHKKKTGSGGKGAGGNKRRGRRSTDNIEALSRIINKP